MQIDSECNICEETFQEFDYGDISLEYRIHPNTIVGHRFEQICHKCYKRLKQALLDEEMAICRAKGIAYKRRSVTEGV
jgi:hypothetical protein